MVSNRSVLFLKHVESKTRTHNEPVGSGRRTAGRQGGRGWVGRAAVGSIPPGDNPPFVLQRIEDNCPGRLFGSTNKRNPTLTDGGTKSAVHPRLTRG